MSARSESDVKDPTTMELVGDRTIRWHRSFRAPARIVFDAWTRPEHVRRWWAPRKLGVEIVDVEADVKVGGRHRYQMRPRGGDVLAFSGEYLEVDPPRRVVYTQGFEQMPGEPAVITVTFDEVDGVTTLTALEVYPSAQVRDVVISTGMEAGARNTFDQLAELVAGLA